MKLNKKIYILMATYNGEKFLKDQIDSILKQTYKNWILWIHDDNSTDNTVNIIKEYQNKYPDKIKFVDDNISTGGAKENFAYLLGKIDDNFDYLMFSDQDDVWLKNKIELTLDKMLEVERKNKSKPVLVHTDLKVVDENLNIISDSLFKYQKLILSNQNNLKKLLIENVITGCTMMLNKPLSNLVKNIPGEAIMHDWWIGIVTLKNNGIIESVNVPTVLYRQHNANSIGAKKISLLYYLNNILKGKLIIEKYILIKNQATKANINIKFTEYIMYKAIFTLWKLLH